ncbi:MAG: hypothetical protein FRX49_11369 [Trebouxia sp. A1-2]|nr:MAG: hypothetical protein FRX49_11369 [Trebouxia sp. A1-2]
MAASRLASESRDATVDAEGLRGLGTSDFWGLREELRGPVLAQGSSWGCRVLGRWPDSQDFAGAVYSSGLSVESVINNTWWASLKRWGAHLVAVRRSSAALMRASTASSRAGPDAVRVMAPLATSAADSCTGLLDFTDNAEDSGLVFFLDLRRAVESSSSAMSALAIEALYQEELGPRGSSSR